jgi:hypothetical protein
MDAAVTLAYRTTATPAAVWAAQPSPLVGDFDASVTYDIVRESETPATFALVAVEAGKSPTLANWTLFDDVQYGAARVGLMFGFCCRWDAGVDERYYSAPGTEATASLTAEQRASTSATSDPRGIAAITRRGSLLTAEVRPASDAAGSVRVTSETFTADPVDLLLILSGFPGSSTTTVRLDQPHIAGGGDANCGASDGGTP